MTVQEIIDAAKAGIVQGADDPMWSDDEWLDYVHEAQDMIASAICDADLPYYLASDEELALTDGVYPLPENCRSVREVRNGLDDSEIYPHDENDDEDSASFTIENQSIKLMHWTEGNPSTLVIDMRVFPKDDMAVSDTPEAPLNGKRGGRILARVTRMLAKIKDESATEEEYNAIKLVINNYVDRIGSMYDKDAYFQ